MRYQLIRLGCAVFLTSFLGACKRAESPGPSASPTTESRPSRPPPETRPANAKPSASPASNVVLRVKWPVGNRYVYRIDLNQHSTNRIPQMPKPVQQDVTLAMTYAITVVKETDHGGHELEMEFLANDMDMKMNGQAMLSFDSKQPAQNEAQNPVTAPLRKMIGSKVRLQLDAEGKLERVLNLEEWSNALAGSPGPARGVLTQQFNEGFFRQIIDAGRGLPDKPVDLGESWPFQMDMPEGSMGKISIEAKITFQDWAERNQHRCAVLKTQGTIKGAPGQGQTATPMSPKMSVEEGVFSGTSWFDPELGALVESDTDRLLHIKGEAAAPGAQPGAAFTLDLGQKLNMNLVELTSAKK